jgi:tetratricopeptide (TPR) repeat protein
VTSALPGFVARATGGPEDVATERLFFKVRGEATRARLNGELEHAVERYRAALALWPGHDDCLYYLGHCLAERGEESEALATWEAQVAFVPSSSRGWMQLGLMRLPGGDSAFDDLELAEEAFWRSQRINPEESRPVVELGVVALLKGELETAHERFSDAARLNPRSIQARYLSGRVAFLAGDHEAALAFLKQAHALARGGDGQAGGSVSGEGDTASGQAMLADAHKGDGDPLSRWTTLAERECDVETEYGGPQR